MKYSLPVLCLSMLLLAGCAATMLALEKKDLKVETIMSETIFLDVENQTGKRIYVDIKNTSDKDIQIRERVINNLAVRGFTVAATAKQADYILQVNILQVGTADPSALRENVQYGYGVPLAGLATGAIIGKSSTGGSHSGLLTGAGIGMMAGFAAETVAGSLVKDVTYSIITDVMVSEKTSFKVQESQYGTHSVGKGTSRTQSVSRASNRQRYQTRIASFANKVNLSFEQALPAIEDGLTKSIAGIF